MSTSALVAPMAMVLGMRTKTVPSEGSRLRYGQGPEGRR